MIEASVILRRSRAVVILRRSRGICFSILTATLFASPALAQAGVGDDGPWLIRGATVVTGTGERLANTNIIVRNGRIERIGAGITTPNAKVVEAAGKFVYPGMVDANTPLGLVEISGVQTMTLRSEIGQFNPHLKAIVALNMDSELLGVTRMSGVTSVLTSPTGGLISGQAALINTSGWTWEDIGIRPNAGIIINLPSAGGAGGGRGGRGGAAAVSGNTVADLNAFMAAAKDYHTKRAANAAKSDLIYEPMRALFNKEVAAIIPANGETGIRNAIDFGDQWGIKVVILGGGQAWRVRSLLAQKQVPVILNSLMQNPAPGQPYDEVYAQPGLLNEAGVKFAFSTGGGANARHVPLSAALAVAYGLPKDAALKALTIWPAEILGADKDIGTIAPGKLANFVITSGDPMDLRTEIVDVFIKGRMAPDDDRHTRLWQKYKSRPLPIKVP
ncbi:MAG TPA: amidohydrolase family protein [Gemmatimonadaceae bacterium]|nr:amidohydrolase family protein [Gemmatimonadaceae bacterium]